MADLFQDLVNLFGPDKGFGILIVDADELLNGLDQIRDTLENTAADSFARNFTKPALDQIEPGRTRGRKMQMKARVFFQPLRDILMVVGSIIIQDQMQFQSRRGFAVDLSEEF